MTEPQTEYDTDAEPTPGPWETDVTPNGDFSADIIADREVVGTVNNPAGGISRGNWKANARLIAAAGTAAQEAKEMGYDPVAVVEAVPQMLAYMEDFQKALSSLDRNFPGTFESELNELCSFLNALARAEGSDQ